MNFDPLDNPGWHALNSHQRHLAIRGVIAARYQPDILAGAAMHEYNQAGFDDLGQIVNDTETIGFILESLPEELTGWKILFSGLLPQMVCEDLKSSPRVDAVELTLQDVPEMLDLIALTEPGPFLPRTIEMGRYLGVRQDNKLVAMAGERLHLNGFCEISAVCTHPDYRGRGYGSALTTLVGQNILARDEIPFLHHAPNNQAAMRLYSKLGFRKRRNLSMAFLKNAIPDRA